MRRHQHSYHDKDNKGQNAQNNKQQNKKSAQIRKNTIIPPISLAEQRKIKRHTIMKQLHCCQILQPVMHLNIGNKYQKTGKDDGSNYLRECKYSLALWMVSLMHPLIDAVTRAIIGLVPALHRLFSDSPKKGGYFKAWLTESTQNIGLLFPALQKVVVGAKLSSSLTKMKKGEASGSVPWTPVLAIFIIRFIKWPAQVPHLSISHKVIAVFLHQHQSRLYGSRQD